MGDPVELTASIETSPTAIGREAWDACAGTAPLVKTGIDLGDMTRALGNPFLSYDFVEALEAAGCATVETGWLGQHIVLRSASDDILAIMPCYLKNHSFGEYVFDHAWADAFERAGGQYYPKLQASIPFAPVEGPRLMVRAGVDREMAQKALASAALQLTERHGASSLHLTFLPKDEWEHLGRLGFLRRTGQQFHWTNQNYSTFDDFLAALASRKRKAIRKERQRAVVNDIEIETLSGSDLTETHWDAFYQFYVDTGERKWGQPYLNREFFSLIGERMADQIVLILAKRNGRYIAGALNFIGVDTLFGRYWGAIEHHEFLHFELCFYQAIDYAIAHGLGTVEAGAGGEHKLSRGYLPTTTYSAHFIAHSGLRNAISDYLEDERQSVEFEQELLGEHAPFRNSSDDKNTS